MKKVRIYLDFDKEEKWLQSMAKQGWQLLSVCFTYTFKKSLLGTGYRTAAVAPQNRKSACMVAH